MSRRAERRNRPRSQATTAKRDAAAATPRVPLPTKSRSMVIVFVMEVVEVERETGPMDPDTVRRRVIYAYVRKC
jgi:hypothetical protein